MQRIAYILRIMLSPSTVLTTIMISVCASLAVTPTRAQGLAQVNLSGIPPVLSSPLVSEIATQFEQGRFPMTFVFNSPDRQQNEFVFRVQLDREGDIVLDVTSDAVTYTRGVYTYTSLDAGPAITFPATYQDVVDALGAGLDQNLDRTGLLSEGLYTLTVEAIPSDPDALVITVPGSATFAVQYLEPPMLLSPAYDEVLGDRLPVFTWLPVLGGPVTSVVEYEFLLVEIYPEQEPSQAIEANRPIEQAVVTGITTLPYTLDRLPLEPGSRYAWQVAARDADGLLPFADGGRSEISTFIYAPARPALAEWVYPFSRPPVVFNLGSAELTSDGYAVHGFFEGSAGQAPVSAFFEDLVLDAATLDIASGRVVLMDGYSEAVGMVESDALGRLLVDDTPPTRPFVNVRSGRGRAGARLDVVVGPAQDPESGVRSVAYRLAEAGAGSMSGVGGWESVFESERLSAEFGGGSYGMALSESAARALTQDQLQLEVRLQNGLGLETRIVSQVGSSTDVSPPIVVQPRLVYAGYYDIGRPNTVEVSDIRVTDAESDIVAIEYRLVSNEQAGEWAELAAPRARAFRGGQVVIQLPPVESDAAVRIDFRATNAAGLRAEWSEVIDIDIDETEPVMVGELARYVTSESDPRIEISREAIADYQSGIQELSYRVVDDRRPTQSYVDWTSFPPGTLAEVKRTQLNFTISRAVRVEVRAENAAGLSATFAETLVVPELSIGDRTPPQVPTLAVRLLSSRMGADAVIEIRIGSSSDPETGISRVQYRVEDVAGGADLTGWLDADVVSGESYPGSIETVTIRPPLGATALRAVVRVVNGTGAASTAAGQVTISTEDTTPPQIRSVQIYAQAGRVLAFIDGLADAESSISRVDYRILDPGGVTLADWTAYPIVPAGRPSYGRQLLRADIPAAATGTQIIVQIRVTNGSGLETIVEETVALEQ